MRNKLAIHEQTPGQLIVSGDLTFATIDKHVACDHAFIQAPGPITIDLAGLGTTDSAGLALLLEWIKRARALRVRLHFIHLPHQLLALARLTGLETTLLPDHRASLENTNG